MAQPKTINGWLYPEQQEALQAAGYEATYSGLIAYIRSLNPDFPQRSYRSDNMIVPIARELIAQDLLGSTNNYIAERFNCSPSTASKARAFVRDTIMPIVKELIAQDLVNTQIDYIATRFKCSILIAISAQTLAKKQLENSQLSTIDRIVE